MIDYIRDHIDLCSCEWLHGYMRPSVFLTRRRYLDYGRLAVAGCCRG